MLFRKILIILLPIIGFATFNIGFNEFYYKDNFGAVDYKHNLFPDEGVIFDVFVTGNSQPSAGIDFEVTEELQGLNIAFGSQSVNYDYSMYKAFENHMNNNTIALITLTFFSFCDQYEGSLFRYDPFFDTNTTIQDSIIYDYFPLFGLNRFETTLRNLFNADKDSKSLHYNNDFDEWAIDGLNRYNGHKVRANCNQDLYEENFFYIEKLISDNLDNGRRVYILTMPYHESYWGNLIQDTIEYEKFYSRIDLLTSKHDVVHLDYSIDDRFYSNYEYFHDWDHMNMNGADKFTKIIHNDLSEFSNRD